MAIERVGKFKEIYLVNSPKLYVEVCISPAKAVPQCQVLTTCRATQHEGLKGVGAHGQNVGSLRKRRGGYDGTSSTPSSEAR
jgi:hypothetical protein